MRAMGRLALAVAFVVPFALRSSQGFAVPRTPSSRTRFSQNGPELNQPSALTGSLSETVSPLLASSGLAAALVAGVTLLAVPRSDRRPYSHPKRRKKILLSKGKKMRTGELGYLKDVGRSWKILGIASDIERPPTLKIKSRWWVCNRMYKVIRRSSEVEMAPSINETTEQFIRPAVWNSGFFRAAAIMLGSGLAGGVLPFAALLHMAAFGTWFGANIWTTFFAGITMFKNLPRQQFGSLQAKLFPLYFQLGAGCTVAMALTASRMGVSVGPSIVSLVATLANLLYLEPKATSVMFQRYDRENLGLKNEAIDKDLKAQFGKLHGMSSLANLVALVGLVAHGSLLAARL